MTTIHLRLLLLVCWTKIQPFNAVHSGGGSCDDEITVTTVVKQNNRNCVTRTGTGTDSNHPSTATGCEGCDELKERLDQMLSTAENRVTFCGAGTKDKSRVKDVQFTASSVYDHSSVDHSAKMARLFNDEGAGSWYGVSESASDNWIQLDLESDKFVYGIVTQGRTKYFASGDGRWISTFEVEYRVTGSSFTSVLNDHGEAMVFSGNTDGASLVMNEFPSRVTARYVRIKMQQWYKWPAIRFDVLLC